jgi:hypothetical protein
MVFEWRMNTPISAGSRAGVYVLRWAPEDEPVEREK